MKSSQNLFAIFLILFTFFSLFGCKEETKVNVERDIIVDLISAIEYRTLVGPHETMEGRVEGKKFIYKFEGKTLIAEADSNSFCLEAKEDGIVATGDLSSGKDPKYVEVSVKGIDEGHRADVRKMLERQASYLAPTLGESTRDTYLKVRDKVASTFDKTIKSVGDFFKGLNPFTEKKK